MALRNSQVTRQTIRQDANAIAHKLFTIERVKSGVIHMSEEAVEELRADIIHLQTELNAAINAALSK